MPLSKIKSAFLSWKTDDLFQTFFYQVYKPFRLPKLHQISKIKTFNRHSSLNARTLRVK